MNEYPSPEVYFAQHLASNNPTIRNRAMKKLREWLTGGREFTEEDMLKLWKGLYYCMWMCDKPLNQESLADNISELINCFSAPKTCMRFIDTFFQSMSKEWHGIDRYRIEKYMLLIRRFLFQCFCLLSKQTWNPKLIVKVLKVLKKHVLNPLDDGTPHGLKLHIVDIYLDELAKAGGCDLKPKKLIRFLKPYINFLLVCDDTQQLNAVVKEIFHSLIWQAFHQEDDDDSEDETVVFQVNFGRIADILLKHATSDEIKLKGNNKEVIYKLVAELRTTARGEFPFQNVESDDDHEDFDLKKTDINKAARELLAEDFKIREENRNRLKETRENRKRKQKEEPESDDETFDNDLHITESFKVSERPTKRKKRKTHKPTKLNGRNKKGRKQSTKKKFSKNFSKKPTRKKMSKR